MVKIQKKISAGEDALYEQEPHSLLVGVWNGTVILKDCLAESKKARYSLMI